MGAEYLTIKLIVICSWSDSAVYSFFVGSQWAIPLTSADISMPQIDCSHSNQITVRYPNISQVHEIETPIELLLNCSSDGFQVRGICIIIYQTIASVLNN
jgi:hypothetical protein